ncbi:hypothetical protein PUN28_005013 [Cardiocondyla obscurior]|uniref:Uncharacterized protein n=1 Tax=Cardiocondyla obscurior TaxID=286306 RepID=A0AAW2GIB4_9HYME
MYRRLDVSGLAILIVRCVREARRRSWGVTPASFSPPLSPPSSSPSPSPSPSSSWTSTIRSPIPRPPGSVALRSSPRLFAS